MANNHVVLMCNGNGTYTPLFLHFLTLERCESEVTHQKSRQPANIRFIIKEKTELSSMSLFKGDWWKLEAWNNFLMEVHSCKKIQL